MNLAAGVARLARDDGEGDIPALAVLALARSGEAGCVQQLPVEVVDEEGPRNMPLVAIVSRRALIGWGPLSFAQDGCSPQRAISSVRWSPPSSSTNSQTTGEELPGYFRAT